MKKINIAIILLVIIGVAGVLYRNTNHTVEQGADVIKIGTIMSETGIASSFGTMSRQGAELAVDEINAKGGINGKKIILITENDNTDPKVAAGLYTKLTSINHVDAIIGSNFDFTVQPVFNKAKTGDTVVITPTAARIQGSLDTNAQSFSMLVDFSRIVFALKEYMIKTPYSKLAVIHYTSGFGNQIVTTLGDIAVKQGKKVPMDESYSTFGTTDWKPYILKMKKAGVDLVFADMLGDDLLRFTKDAKALGFTAKIMTHSDVRGVLGKEGADTSTLEGVVVLNWDVLHSNEFDAHFTATYGVAPMNHASQSYKAVYTLAKAIAKNGKANLPKTLETEVFTTPLGPSSFDINHSAKDTPIKVQIIKDRTLVDLYSI